VKRAAKVNAAPARRTVREVTEDDAAEAEPQLPATPAELTSKRRRELRADAHGLEPIVHVGHGGVTESVVRAVSRALHDHELIKVRLHDPEDKKGMAAELADATRSALCGLVGHTVILFRAKPKKRGVSGVARTAIKRNRERRGRR
jgi:RNA-binding protein